MRKWVHLDISPEIRANLEIICEAHKISMNTLVSRIVTSVDDKTLLQAIEPVSKVLRRGKEGENHG